MKSKKRTIGIVVIIVLFCIVGGIFIFNNQSKHKGKEESTSSNVYNEKVDSAIDSVLFKEDYNSLSLNEKKDKMLSILYQLEKDGEILKDSIFYQEKIIWFKYSDGTESGVVLEEWTAGFGGSADISNYVTAWNNNGMPSILESEINISDLTKPFPSLSSTNSKINFSNPSYSFLEEDIKSLDLSAKYMFGWCDSNDTFSNCYRYLIDYQENQKIWSNNYLKTDLDDYCTIEDFKTGLLNYNIVFIQEHGALYKNIPIICTREEYDKSKYNDDKKHLIFTKGTNGKYYYYIKPSFFEKYYGDGKLKDTIVWIGSCHGYQYNDLSFAFEKCGASAVVGYNESILLEYDKCLQNAFVYDLMYGSTVKEALEFSKKIWTQNDKDFTTKYSKYFANCGIGTEAKVNINGENAKLIRLEERNVQLKIYVMEEGNTSNLLTNKNVEITINNPDLKFANNKAQTNKEGIVMFELNTNVQDLIAKTDITLHIDGYQDFTISNYGMNTQGNMPNEVEVFMKPVKVTEPTKKSDNKTGEVKIEDGYLNIRDKPSTKGKIMGKLYNGDRVTIEESSADGKWLKIIKEDIKGYVSKDYIKILEDIEQGTGQVDLTINGNSSWTSEQVINSVNAYLKENWCGENQYYCFESELIENEGYWWVCIRWDGSNSANVITGNDCKINKETGEVEISFNGKPYKWFNLKDYQ